MLLFGVCFFLYFIELSAGKGFYTDTPTAWCQNVSDIVLQTLYG